MRWPNLIKRCTTITTHLGRRPWLPTFRTSLLSFKNEQWRPDSYSTGRWGAGLSLKFLTRKLNDFNTPEELARLAESRNPFAHLVAATIYAQATRPNSKERVQKKYHLVRKLYHLGLSKEKIRHFFKLIDWVLTLSPPLAILFDEKMQQFEKENKMPYITSIEQIQREKERKEGRKEGHKEGREEVARRMLAHGSDRAFILAITELSEQELLALENEPGTKKS